MTEAPSGTVATFLVPEGAFICWAMAFPETSVYASLGMACPFDYNNNFLYISISEPTFSPEILIEFQEDYFEANLIPFFDDSMKLTESASFEGEFEMRAEDLWIMPMSGAIVNIREKDLSDDE